MSKADRPELDDLQRLAAAHGIAADWHDMFGDRHVVPTTTLRALLSAVGVQAESEAAVHSALEQAGREAWRRVLPAAQVVIESEQPASVILRLPQALDAESLEWQLSLEDGSHSAHGVIPQKLEHVDSAVIQSKHFVARRLELPNAPVGYHTFRLLRRGDPLAELALIVTPDVSYQPEALKNGARAWGPTVQLYGLRSQRNWGIGDFTDLDATLTQWARAGASMLGINPLHACDRLGRMPRHNPNLPRPARSVR